MSEAVLQGENKQYAESKGDIKTLLFERPEIPAEVELIEQKSEEIVLSTDQWEEIKRRFLIALNAYGKHDLSRIAAFINVSKNKINELMNDETIKTALKNNEIPCWTKAEIISKLCVESEIARSSRDKITALSKLMEFRSMALPEGGSRNFTRVISKFRKQ